MMSQDNQIREGMSESEIRARGGHVAMDNRVYDREGVVVWTPRGDLKIQNGAATPSKD